MNMRTRIGAILAAGALSLGVVGMALAIEVKDVHQNITVSWDAGGNPVIEAESGEEFSDSDDCDTPAQGWVTFHFVQSGPGVVANAEDNNLLDVDFEDEADVLGTTEDSIQGNGTNVDWFVSVDASDGSVTMVTANSNVVGDEDTLRVSHICVGDAPETETEEPSFEQSQEVETEEPSEVVETDEPSFEQSQEGETDEPSFEQSQAGDTDAPSEPDTATVGGSTNVGSPSNGAWLLMVALGMLLASIVVLTPARAKAPRR